MSELTICGTVLTLYEDIELKQRRSTFRFQEFDDISLKIRKGLAEKFQNSTAMRIPRELRDIYARMPTFSFYTLASGEPVRLFGVTGHNMHALIAGSNFSTYFVIGGVKVNLLQKRSYWNDDHMHIIQKTKRPGLFLDPLGNELAALLGKSVGYEELSINVHCLKCRHAQVKINTESLALDQVRKYMTKCPCQCNGIHITKNCRETIQYINTACNAEAKE